MTTNLKGNGTVTTGSHVSAALLVVKDFLIKCRSHHGSYSFSFPTLRLLFLHDALIKGLYHRIGLEAFWLKPGKNHANYPGPGTFSSFYFYLFIYLIPGNALRVLICEIAMTIMYHTL